MRFSNHFASLAGAVAGLLGPVIAGAQEAGHGGGSVNLLQPYAGLMFWTLIIFVVLLFVLSRYAFKPLTEAVERRERALEEALAAATRDRDEAARVLAEHRAQLEAARAEGQQLIAEARATGEAMRSQMLDETKVQQDELMARVRRDIESEKVKAIAELRHEAVDLALKGASKVLERNLDDATNRKLVDEFLASLTKR
jgi:F-type H+-transporting ATPase subunit b